MHWNIFIPILFNEMLVVDVVINDHQHTPKLRSLLVLEQSLDLVLVDQKLHWCQSTCKCQVYNPTFYLFMNWRGWQSVPVPLTHTCGAFDLLTLSLTVERRKVSIEVHPIESCFRINSRRVDKFSSKTPSSSNGTLNLLKWFIFFHSSPGPLATPFPYTL
jgi:hypothetical protein